MRNNQNGYAVALIVALVVVIVGGAGFIAYRATHKAQGTVSVQAYDPHALMVVTYSGGYCDGPCPHPIHNLYGNGKFEGYKKLSGSEVTRLKNIINTTDFMKYGPNPSPGCPSFADGFDQVLLFPQKYGNKTFTTCMLDIPKNDRAFSYINNLLESHYIQQN